jgi:hypothetical protein
VVPNNFFLEGQIRAIQFMITIKEATVFVTSCSLTCSGCVCSNEIFCVVPFARVSCNLSFGYHDLVEFAQANFFCIAPL